MPNKFSIKIISDTSEKEAFQEKAMHPLQSWEWGEARKKLGIEVIRIGEYSGKKIIHGYQLTLHPVPYTPFKIGYLPRSGFPSKIVLDFLYDYGQKNNIIFIKIEPYLFKSEIIPKTNLRISSHPLFPKWTQILDLAKSEEQLFKSLHPKTRYNIKLAEKKGITVKEMTDQKGFEIFAELYFDTCKRQRYFGHNRFYHQVIFEYLKNSISHLLIAFYKNMPLAVYQLFHFKHRVYYVYGGTSAQFRNLMASNLLMWESIRFAKKLKAQEFDMWGSLPPKYDSSHAWAGFTRFKAGYGGKFSESAGSFDLIMKPALYRIYNKILFLRNLYLKLLL